MTEPHTVVFVCAANVCRSPLMELVLRECLPEVGWSVSSVGTDVSGGTHATVPTSMCPVSAQIAGVEAGAHIARPMTVEELDGSHLIITASRAERAAVATMAPPARSRTFTLREAIHLGALPPESEEWDAAEVTGSCTTPVERYAAVLHRRRGLLAPPTSPRKLLRWRAAGDPLDIPDVHGSKPAVHRAVLRDLADDVRTLGDRISADSLRARWGDRGAARMATDPSDDPQSSRRPAQ